jgi:hypothetical protein
MKQGRSIPGEKHDGNPTRRRYDGTDFLYDFMEAPVERGLLARWRAKLFNHMGGPEAVLTLRYLPEP